MTLYKVEILWNDKVTGNLNPVQYINMEAKTMFIEYNQTADGVICMMQQPTFILVSHTFDLYNIKYNVIGIYDI